MAVLAVASTAALRYVDEGFVAVPRPRDTTTADDYLRAFDERTGKELWRARLPAGGQATPMSYQGADGRQYVVIAAGGHGGLGTRQGDYVMAFALPSTSSGGAQPR